MSLDQIRPDAQEMVQRMHNNNFKVAMLTGDHKEVAEEVILIHLLFIY